MHSIIQSYDVACSGWQMGSGPQEFSFISLSQRFCQWHPHQESYFCVSIYFFFLALLWQGDLCSGTVFCTVWLSSTAKHLCLCVPGASVEVIDLIFSLSLPPTCSCKLRKLPILRSYFNLLKLAVAQGFHLNGTVWFLIKYMLCSIYHWLVKDLKVSSRSDLK